MATDIKDVLRACLPVVSQMTESMSRYVKPRQYPGRAPRKAAEALDKLRTFSTGLHAAEFKLSVERHLNPWSPVKRIEDLLRPDEYREAFGVAPFVVTSTGADVREALTMMPEVRDAFTVLEALDALRSYFATAAKTIEAEEAGVAVVPAADRYVRLDDNRPAVDAAREALEEAAVAVETSNNPEIDPDERKAIAAEIRTLAAMLQERVIRYVQVQIAVGERSVLRYAKGRFKDHLARAAVGKALDLLGAALRSFLGG